MNKNVSLAIAATVAGALAAASAPMANATVTGVKIGVLSCVVAPGVGLIVVSSKAINCEFRMNDGRVSYYHGTTSRFGIAVGVTGKGHLSWAVYAPTTAQQGTLAGRYVGAGAQATVIAGLGANVLIGGSQQTANLQPLSIQGQTGLNLAAGLTSLTLRSGR